jgi:hypothetical protein
MCEVARVLKDCRATENKISRYVNDDDLYYINIITSKRFMSPSKLQEFVNRINGVCI